MLKFERVGGTSRPKGSPMKKVSMSLIVLALGSALSASATATTIFSDDFNRGVSDNVGGGWSEVESDAVDVSLVTRATSDQEMQLRDDDPKAVASQLNGISTLGYTGISLSYDWAPTNNTESGDFLWVEWRDGSGGSWTSLAQHALIGPAGHQSASWNIANAGGLTDFQFRFRAEVNANNEGAYVDNVALLGERSAAAPALASAVPEPGGLALAGLGCALLALSGRRKKALAR